MAPPLSGSAKEGEPICTLLLSKRVLKSVSEEMRASIAPPRWSELLPLKVQLSMTSVVLVVLMAPPQTPWLPSKEQELMWALVWRQ